ncbi:cell division protein FtsH [Candidatus Mycoplasma haematobovis]|uniref:ATP-dependent zinc metalloprotease FtsH n=1 Tax=Candidatus Mycoplasma haematobovis TaxID=432608 RepID=A0A1A9QDF1_9MOLU|nr:ATP-dependent zinc metalloprotease FtsH [Candidatus Mycoplasma haematobovis]OAL10268.1 cell division protein FtsH [Candidatus Mycoplasma haematobovis]
MNLTWKWIQWLDLLSDIDSEESKNKKPSKFIKSLSGGDPNPSRTWLIRGVIGATTLAILYFIFFHGQPKNIEVTKIGCNGGGGLKLTPKNGSGSDETVETDWNSENTYSEKLSQGQGGDVYRIITKEKGKGRKVAFTVTVNKNNGTEIIYSLPNSCSFKKKVDGCCSKGTDCNCCEKGCSDDCCKDCSGDCCKDKCCENGKCCACCCFIRLVHYAISNPADPHRVTPASVFFSLLPTLVYLGFFLFMARSAMKSQSMGMYGGGSIFKIGQSLSKTAKSKITFKDVAGIEEEKEELQEIVDYLKNPSKYNSMGARTPRGVILYGPPGTGKTLLAKAVSGEADVPFLEVAGSSFDDMFVGVGAKRVRELFNKAKKLAPCIIFIDEIDAVAAKRGNKFMGGGVNDQTINQLLSEMDGFNTMTGIVIMAATNKLDSIDEAILRPGRFDRHIQVSLPDIKERTAILKIHARNKNISSSVNLEDVARKTPGFSGAQLENVLNEATLLAVRHNKRVIGNAEVNEAIDRVIAGPAKRNRKISFNEKKQIAYHEAGHAIAGLYSKEGEVVEKITIIPRGKAAGYVLSAPEKQESFIKRKDELLSIILTALAGRAAEEIFFGEDQISSGAANDLYKVTNLVRNMVTKLGMSKKLGLMQYEPSEGAENPYKSAYSDKYSEEIDKEINAIINQQYAKAKSIIIANRDEFLLIVETLLLIETIDKKQIDFIHNNKKLPKEAQDMKDRLIRRSKT